ncbi:hypothetical protein JCM10213_000772 [Rhodosporidiobolus nylandii]
MADGLLDAAFGDFEPDIDDSAEQAALARAERIAAARAASKVYEARVEEPGWFNDPAQVARAKGPARPALFALHERYFQQRYEEAVDGGLKLLKDGVKEEQEARDLVMRAALRCGREKQAEVVELAKLWREYPNLPALSFISARILFANSPMSSASSASPTPASAPESTPTAAECSLIAPVEVLSASLASLRIHPQQPLYTPLLASMLRPSHPLLAEALEDNKRVLAEKRAEVEAQLAEVEVDEPQRDILARVLRLSDEQEDGEEGLGRDVRSL